MSEVANRTLREIPSSGRASETVAERRARIVEAAITELKGKGFPVVKVEDIARRAGMDKRTMYDYIVKKEDILVLVFDQYLTMLLTELRRAAEMQDAQERLYTMLLWHSEVIVAHPDFPLFLYREIRYLAPEDFKHVHRVMDQIHSAYVDVFSELTDEVPGLLGSDPVLLASSALSLIDMIGTHRKRLSGRDAKVFADHIYAVTVGPLRQTPVSNGTAS